MLFSLDIKEPLDNNQEMSKVDQKLFTNVIKLDLLSLTSLDHLKLGISPSQRIVYKGEPCNYLKKIDLAFWTRIKEYTIILETSGYEADLEASRVQEAIVKNQSITYGITSGLACGGGIAVYRKIYNQKIGNQIFAIAALGGLIVFTVSSFGTINHNKKLLENRKQKIDNQIREKEIKVLSSVNSEMEKKINKLNKIQQNAKVGDISAVLLKKDQLEKIQQEFTKTIEDDRKKQK